MESITGPSPYIQAFKEVGTVFQLGIDILCYDWKSSYAETLKQTKSWHFTFSQLKRFVISRSKMNNARVRDEIITKVIK